MAIRKTDKLNKEIENLEKEFQRLCSLERYNEAQKVKIQIDTLLKENQQEK